jgi:beta-galactosidase GanA
MTRKTGFPPHKLVRLALALAATASLAAAQSKPIPQLVSAGGKFTFLVDGKPFLILGGQVVNDGAYLDRLERVWPKLKSMSANTIEYPVYWNEIEREEGKYDFRDFDRILLRARAEGFRVDLLWFGTWKNGAMDWAPNWVKTDTARFPRVLDAGGKPIRVLSPHSRATLEADKKAYAAMMTHLRQMDEADRTVILVQVENESGLLGSVRDYSAESTKLFNGPVPAALVTALKKKPGTWTEVFGSRLAEEAFTTYYVSSY